LNAERYVVGYVEWVCQSEPFSVSRMNGVGSVVWYVATLYYPERGAVCC
jgi:hypothetical protein